MKKYDKCVYTIVHSSIIDNIIAGKQKPEIYEKRNWKSAKLFLEEAKKAKQVFYCVLAPAEDTTFLYAFAELEKIEIDENKKGSTFTLSNVKRLPNKEVLKTRLKMLKGGSIPFSYIRPYVLCKTNSIIKNLKPQEDLLSTIHEGNINPEKKEVLTTTFQRDSRIKDYVLKRAKNKCELCNSSAPFYNRNGEPYFEIHHLIPLSEGGEDTINNTVCLCPNCHRELHFGKDAEIKTKKLKDKNTTQ